jgi:hypothetical protein
MMTKLVRGLTADGVARVLATALTDWPGTATELAEEILDGWPLMIRVREREERKLGKRDSFRLEAEEGTPCHWRKGQTILDTGGGEPMVVADTESTLLMPRLPSRVIAGLAGGTPLGTLLEPYGALRLDRLALAVHDEMNERGEPLAVRSSAVLARETAGGHIRVAIAAEWWTMEFCKFVSMRTPALLGSAPSGVTGRSSMSTCATSDRNHRRPSGLVTPGGRRLRRD